MHAILCRSPPRCSFDGIRKARSHIVELKRQIECIAKITDDPLVAASNADRIGIDCKRGSG